MNTEIDPSQLLTRLASEESTGCLEIVYESIVWNIYLRFGKLLVVDCSLQSLKQLVDRLRFRGYDRAAQEVKVDSDNLVRQELERLALQGVLDRSQLERISTDLTKEAFESLLWLRNEQMKWLPDRPVPTIATGLSSLPSLNLFATIEYHQQRLKIWQKFTTIIQSPHQRPYLTNAKFLETPVSGGTLSYKALNQIVQLMKGRSIRDLGLLLKQDELKLVQLLTPYLRHNAICLRGPAAPFDRLPLIPEPDLLPVNSVEQLPEIAQKLSTVPINPDLYQIACIDDSPLILDEMERFLGNKGKYQLTKLEDPIKASGLIFRLKPDLILMDITMPGINGYKLCSLFRSSTALAQTPIIMVTGNKGLVDRVRANLVGATDYLTKPFTEQDLLALVDKYLTPTSADILELSAQGNASAEEDATKMRSGNDELVAHRSF
jgi:two-component system, chemotaxis family, response regulator PixG